MIITEDWLRTKFDEFNSCYFNNELPIPRFKLIKSEKLFGQCGANNWRTKHPDFVIKISTYYDRSEHDIRNTLLHEMIHLSFQSKGNWSEGHGENFQRIARSFDKYGWNIHTKEYLSASNQNEVDVSIDKGTLPLKSSLSSIIPVSALRLFEVLKHTYIEYKPLFKITTIIGFICVVFLTINWILLIVLSIIFTIYQILLQYLESI